MSEANYNKQSGQCRRRAYPFPNGQPIEIGDFCWGDKRENGDRYLYIRLPGGEGPDAIRTTQGTPHGETGSYTWHWDGNEDKPTLSPSLHWVGRWHGFLTAGKLVSC